LFGHASLGLKDMERDPNRYYSGLMNAVIFSRMVTFSLQNMKNDVPEFDAWYKIQQDDMANDPAMKFFLALRNEMEKTANNHLTASTYIASFSDHDKGIKPPGATDFVLGSVVHGGANGWIIPAEDGSEALYAVNFPPEKIKTTMIFLSAPEHLQGTDVKKLVQDHLSKLRQLVAAAKAKFLAQVK
jgi:hypothetical protein